MKKQRIIGMFDSGVGGLTVMKEILDQIEDVRIIYVGDTARVPYGNRTLEELIRFGEEIITFLISQGAEVIVAACNTSSATALPLLKDRFDIPLIGMIEPGARLAVEHTTEGRIGLIATEATVRSKTYASAVSKALAKGVFPQSQRLVTAWQQGEQPIALVKAQACPLFVPLVEAGLANSAEARGIARTYLEPIAQAEVDTLILGCTHYPFLTPVLHEVLGDGVALVDPALAVVEEVHELLYRLDVRDAANKADTEDKADTAVEPVNRWRVRYFVSGDPGLFRQVGNTLLPEPIGEVRKITWGE